MYIEFDAISEQQAYVSELLATLTEASKAILSELVGVQQNDLTNTDPFELELLMVQHGFIENMVYVSGEIDF